MTTEIGLGHRRRSRWDYRPRFDLLTGDAVIPRGGPSCVRIVLPRATRISRAYLMAAWEAPRWCRMARSPIARVLAWLWRCWATRTPDQRRVVIEEIVVNGEHHLIQAPCELELGERIAEWKPIDVGAGAVVLAIVRSVTPQPIRVAIHLRCEVLP